MAKLNHNIRCIEIIREDGILADGGKLNHNIRCIEIGFGRYTLAV